MDASASMTEAGSSLSPSPAPAMNPNLSNAYPMPKRKRKKKQRGTEGNKSNPARGTKSMFGPNQVRSRMRSSPSFSMGTSERPKERQTISPGPVFYPKPTSKWLGDAPSYSFSGEYGSTGALPALPAAQGTFTPEQMDLLEEAAKTTPIPKRFAGLPATGPGPGQYRVNAQMGFGRCKSGAAQVLSKNRTGPRYSLATKARPPKSVTVSPGPAAYTIGSTAVGRQSQARYRNNGGFGFGGEMRGYEMQQKYSSPGPGAHIV